MNLTDTPEHPVMRYIRRHAWASYLGMWAVTMGYSPTAWPFYTLIIPVALLSAWANIDRA